MFDRFSTMKEVGVPNQDLALHGDKFPLDETKLLNSILPMLFEEALGVRFNGHDIRRKA
jgi:hypothetical protein